MSMSVISKPMDQGGGDHDDDLEKYFLQDIDDLDDDETAAAAQSADPSASASCSLSTSVIASPRYVHDETRQREAVAGRCDTDAATDPDTFEWDEFLRSANALSDKMINVETTIADARASSEGSATTGVTETVSVITVSESASPSGVLSPDTAALNEASNKFAPDYRDGPYENIDAKTVSAVTVILEDMLLSLEQLWETMTDKSSNPQTATALLATSGDTTTISDGKTSPSHHNDYQHLTIIGDDDDVYDPTVTPPVDVDGSGDWPSVTNNIASLQKAKKLALEISLNAEHEQYLQQEKEFERQKEEDRLRLERRQARRVKEAQKRRNNKATLFIQRICRGYLGRKLFVRRREIVTLRAKEQERIRESAESLLMWTEESNSTAAWKYFRVKQEEQEQKARELEMQLALQSKRLRDIEEEARRVTELNRLADLQKQQQQDNNESKRLAAAEAEETFGKVKAEQDKAAVAQRSEVEKRKQQESSNSHHTTPTKNGNSAQTSTVTGNKKKGSSWGGVILGQNVVNNTSSSVIEEDTDLVVVDRESEPDDRYATVVRPPTISSTPNDVVATAANMDSGFPIGGVAPEPLSTTTVAEIAGHVTMAQLAFGSRTNAVNQSICGIERNTPHLSTSPTKIGSDCCSELLLYGAYMSWKDWLSSQPGDVKDIFFDISLQNQFADCLDNLNSSRSAPSGTGESRNIAEYTVENLENLDFLSNKTDHLRHLILNVNRLVTLRDLSGLVELDSLSVKDNRLRNLDGLRDMHKLRCLVLDVNQINDMTDINALKSLVVLSANTNNLTEVPCLDSPYLQRLNLYHNQICSITSLSAVRSRVLTHLDLGRNKLKYISGEALSQCQLLTQLILSQNCLEVAPFPLRLPNLRKLWISGNRLIGLKEWAPVIENRTPVDFPCYLPMLETLYLQDNSIRSLCAHSLSSMPLLILLDMSFNSIGDSVGVNVSDGSLGEDILLGVKECRHLRTVQLQDNPVNVHRIALLSYLLPLCPALREISGLPVTDILPVIPRHVSEQRRALDALERLLMLDGTNGCDDSKHSEGKRGQGGIVGDSSNDTAAMAYAHPYAGAISDIKSRVGVSSDACSKQKDPSLFSLRYQLNLQTAVRFMELICCVNSAALSEKYSTKFELKRAKTQSAVESSSSSSVDPPSFSRIGPGSGAIYDPLSSSGVEPTSTLFLLLRNVNMMLSWRPDSRDNSGPGNEIYKTVNGSGETGYLYGSAEASATVQNTDRDMFGVSDADIDAKSNTNRIVECIQRHYRGHRIRRQINRALATVRYEDDELDDDAMFGVEDLLQGMGDMPDELADDYWKVGRVSATEATPTIYKYGGSCGESFGGGQMIASSLVYGDHIRARSGSSRNSNRVSNSADTGSAGSSDQHMSRTDVRWDGEGHEPGHLSDPRAIGGSKSGWAEAVSISTVVSGVGSRPPSSSRPMTNMSDISVASSQAHSVDEHEYYTNDRSTKSTPRVDKNKIIADEWGFTDPHVIEAMKKRNKRMKGFSEAKDKREKSKSADERLKTFVRQAARRSSEGTGAGSFGGKPKQFKGIRPRKQGAVHPAWLGGADSLNNNNNPNVS